MINYLFCIKQGKPNVKKSLRKMHTCPKHIQWKQQTRRNTGTGQEMQAWSSTAWTLLRWHLSAHMLPQCATVLCQRTFLEGILQPSWKCCVFSEQTGWCSSVQHPQACWQQLVQPGHASVPVLLCLLLWNHLHSQISLLQQCHITAAADTSANDKQ